MEQLLLISKSLVKVLLIGKSGRVDAIASKLKESKYDVELHTLSEVNNPGLVEKSSTFRLGNTEDVEFIRQYALEVQPDFAVIGPEEPLGVGVVDMLKGLGIPCVGPTQRLAQIETSKSFTRGLLVKYNIPGNPEFKVFTSLDGLELYLREKQEFVIKPDGLTGGKGVKVYGEHLHSIEEALEYCETIIAAHHGCVIVEERLDGEEFSLQSFSDGKHVVDMVVAQDHKRASTGDSGPNTGGMGSYSCEDHSLPFITDEHLREASHINAQVVQALREELGEEYKGILYGGFMVTQTGVKLIEYNARFGDPEVMNVLPLLKSDFVDVCQAIINGTLNKNSVEFDKKATVCKYVVPKGYPTKPVKNQLINMENVPKQSDKLKIYYGAVHQEGCLFYLTGSRAIAFVGIGDNLMEAEEIAEEAASKVQGPVYHRKDIGTYGLILRRIEHIRKITKKQTHSTP